MPNKRYLWHKTVLAVLLKDIACECRVMHIIATVFMFAVVVLSVISMGLGGIGISSALAAVLFWVVVFFSAMAGLARSFTKEMESGTLFTLKVYAGAQTVLFGKLVFNFVVLAVLTAVITALFIIFFNIEVTSWALLVCTLLLGGVGLAAVATLTAALIAGADGSSALFTVISFPVLIPLLLTATQVTEAVFAGFPPDNGQLLFLLGYDVTVIVAASILFDYLW